MKLKGKTAIAFAALLLFIFLGTSSAYAPDSGDPPQTSSVGAAGIGGPSLEIDGEKVDLTRLLNSQIPLFNGQASGVLFTGTAAIDPVEKRLQIVVNDTVIGMQFLNAAVRKEQNSPALKYLDTAQAALVITAPQVDMISDSLIEVSTSGAGKKRLCFLLDLESQNGTTIIKNMTPVSFPGKTSNFSFLVNESSPLGKDYVPSDLVAIPRTVPAIQSKSNMQLSGEAAFYLEKMLLQAKNEGLGGFILSSTYRPFSYQSMLFSNKIKQVGSEAAAARIVARPGTSEHQSGLAIDFSVGGGLNEGFSRTPQGQWLGKNSWKSGYILRYPANKTDITKIIYEPWHFRYVGYPYSKIMYDRKLCLEEYTYNLKRYGFYAVSDENSTYLVVFDPGNQKVYLSKAVPKTPGQ